MRIRRLTLVGSSLLLSTRATAPSSARRDGCRPLPPVALARRSPDLSGDGPGKTARQSSEVRYSAGQ